MKLTKLLATINGVWAIDPTYAEQFLPIALNIMQGNVQKFKSDELDDDFTELNIDGAFYVSPYGYNNSPERAPMNSVAIIQMNDVITKYDQACGDSGTLTKTDLLSRCMQNPLIKGVIIEMDSGGGEAYAGMQMEAAIRDLKSKFDKPIVAFISDFCASACYMIASACDMIVANQPLAKVGSIGTFVTLADYKEFFAKQGIKILDIYADDSTDKNKAYRDAVDKGEFKLIKEDLNTINDNFINIIQTNRKGSLTKDQKTWGTGKVFFANEAEQIGLIDDISTLEDVVKSILN